MPDTGAVFISHITDEAPIADALKVYLHRCFGPALRVFVSSDYVSIPTGDEWHRAILSGIRDASLFVVLLSRESVERRWINFESGFAWGANVKKLPLTIRGFSPGEVGFPLSQLHVRTLADGLALEGVVHAVAKATGAALLTLDDPSGFVAQLAQIEAILPVKSIILEPVLQNQSSGRVLRFRLSNTGNRAAELIEIEVRVPKFIIQPSWYPQTIPNIVSADWRKVGIHDHLVLWEQPFAGAPDVLRYGPFNTLPRIVSPHWTPRLSDLLKVPIRADLEWPEKWFVSYKVVADGPHSEGSIKLTDIPVEA